MKILFIAPHFPAEMPQFTRALAEVGAEVWGAGNVPASHLSGQVRHVLAGYLELQHMLDERLQLREAVSVAAPHNFDCIETHWEPTVLLAARLRDALGVPGMDADTVMGFRDKALMKERLRAAGLRVPLDARIRKARQAWIEADRIGYPLVIKPISGAGSQDTYRVDNASELEDALSRMGHVEEASLEEYIEGDEFTFDAVSIDGKPQFESVAHYFPKPIESRSQEWISPAQIVFRDPTRADLQAGVELGRAALGALGMKTGFTHMEWYRTPSGEAVFGEIACRAPGGKLVDQMNFANDFDVYRGWAQAVVHGRFVEQPKRSYHVATVFKRAMGRGRIQRIEGLAEVRTRCGSSLVASDLLPIGHPRRDWRQTLLSDGSVTVRHPDYETVFSMMAAVIGRLRMYAA